MQDYRRVAFPSPKSYQTAFDPLQLSIYSIPSSGKVFVGARGVNNLVWGTFSREAECLWHMDRF